jgi:Uma2 family endonuclease
MFSGLKWEMGGHRMSDAGTAVMTAEQLMRLPSCGKRYELKRGELLMTTPSGALHGDVTMALGALMRVYANQKKLGKVLAAETGFKIHSDPDTVRAPDVAFVAQERIPPTGVPRGYWELAPDLVVEVVSPNDSAAEVQDKIEEWLNAGVRRVWVVYPDTQTIHVYRSLKEVTVLKPGDKLDGEDVLPGFSHSVEEIFAS